MGVQSFCGESLESINNQWMKVLGILRAEVGESAYRSWLKPLVLVGESEAGLCMSVPTRFMRDWVVNNYHQRICVLWREVAGFSVDVNIIVVSPAKATGSKAPIPGREAGETLAEEGEAKLSAAGLMRLPDGVNPAEEEALSAATLPRSATGHLDPRFTFEDFVVGCPNELAYAAARRVAEAEEMSFNPLFLYGGVGLGKTHLMHAIAWQIKRLHPRKRVIYLSAEKFMYRFIQALQTKNTMPFKEEFRSVDVLMVDDVQFIGGRGATQEEFFHTFNALVDQNRQVVISADKSPSDLEGVGERMRSRMGCGLVVDIHPTTYELRLRILESKVKSLDVKIPRKVIEFLARKITSNVRELEGALIRIVAQSTLVGRSVSLETTQEVLHDLLRRNERRVTIEEIQKKVAEHFTIKVADLHSSRRARAVARPRQIAMFLSKQLTSCSLPEIGRKFGGRDHTTVMYAVRKVEELIEGDTGFAKDVALLKQLLES